MTKNNKTFQLDTDSFNNLGFTLEKKTLEIINRANLNELKSTSLQKVLTYDDKRIDIDVFVKLRNLALIIECKKGTEPWVFYKNKEYQTQIHFLINFENNTNFVSKIIPTKELFYGEAGFIGHKKENKIKPSNKKEESDKLHFSILQVLKNMQAFFIAGKKEEKFEKAIIPLIVTNAPLFSFTYDNSDINQDGNLENEHEIVEVPFVVTQFKQDFFGDIDKVSIIPNKSDFEMGNISVFICNINHLSYFIEQFTGAFDKLLSLGELSEDSIYVL